MEKLFYRSISTPKTKTRSWQKRSDKIGETSARGEKKAAKAKENTGFIQKIATIFQGLFKHFSRTTLDFQGPPTRTIISQIVQ